MNYWLLLLPLQLFHFTEAVPSRVPSLSEIQNINDPELNSIFKSSRLSGSAQQTPEPTFSEFSNVVKERSREIPIERETGFEPNTYQPNSYYQHSRPASSVIDYQNNAQWRQLAHAGAETFVNGAQAFVSGAQQVGHAFGVDPSNLLNVGRGILGKK